MSSFTADQLQALASIASGMTPEQVGRQIGKSPRTVQRWLLRPEFVAAMEEIREKTAQKVVETVAERSATTIIDAANEIRALIPDSLAFLRELINDPGARNADRLRAVQIIGNWSGLNRTAFEHLAMPIHYHPTTSEEARLVFEWDSALIRDRELFSQALLEIDRFRFDRRMVCGFLASRGIEPSGAALMAFCENFEMIAVFCEKYRVTKPVQKEAE